MQSCSPSHLQNALPCLHAVMTACMQPHDILVGAAAAHHVSSKPRTRLQQRTCRRCRSKGFLGVQKTLKPSALGRRAWAYLARLGIGAGQVQVAEAEVPPLAVARTALQCVHRRRKPAPGLHAVSGTASTPEPRPRNPPAHCEAAPRLASL